MNWTPCNSACVIRAGTTILIYEQMCATEKRRRRSRGLLPKLARRTLINEAVCEGCGDCSQTSNCLSIEPVETAFGTKRRINQSSCNQDFTCVKGFCPSFVIAEGAQPKKPKPLQTETRSAPADNLPQPLLPSSKTPYRILITGVGGNGVVTIGALIGMAAHLEHKGTSVLDMTGLAQKGGAVTSHVQIADNPAALCASRIATAEANLLLGCDSIVSASREVLSRSLKGLTRGVVNSSETPTAEFILNRDWHFPGQSIHQDLQATLGDDCHFLDANALAVKLLGNAIYANALLLGYVWQQGWLPLQLDSLLQAIRINGVQVENNQQALHWGRYFAVHDEQIADMLQPATETRKATGGTDNDTAIAVIERYQQLLSAYQNPAYAQRYQALLQPLLEREQGLRGSDSDLPLTALAARHLGRLMAYKDEYEVARLYSEPAFMEQLRAIFEGEPGQDYQVHLQLAPPLLARKDANGHPVKRAYGPWMFKLMPWLAKLKFLRGTALDVFGYSAERRQERALIREYAELVDQVARHLNKGNQQAAQELLDSVAGIRGFGHIRQRSQQGFAAGKEALLKRFLDSGVKAAA
ncbi:MAG: DUF6537 domain-containing protein [Thiolinea sp.]